MGCGAWYARSRWVRGHGKAKPGIQGESWWGVAIPLQVGEIRRPGVHAAYSLRKAPRRDTVATELIIRGSLRDEIVDRLRSLLVEGDLAPGARINESTLSRELGVSRTPLREALLLLSGEGLVVCEPARGFLAAPLTVAQARDAFPILAVLEVLALRSSKGVALHRLDQLRSLQAEYESAQTLAAARAVDERWHGVLTSGSSNEALRVQIERLRAIERRYWLATAALAGRWPQPSWIFQHAAVMEAVDEGDTDAACEALERHWSSSMRETLSSLARRAG